MISSRYASSVAILLSLALVPTIIHSYLNLAKDNGPSSKAVATHLGEFIAYPTLRQPTWGTDIFGCTDWFERSYRDKHGNSAKLFVGRAYDHKRLYHHPELGLSYARDLRESESITLPGTPPIPLHILRHGSRPEIAAYALFYDGHFIEDPIVHQIKDSLSLLVSPKKPMTLFYISEDNLASETSFTKTLSAKVLTEAIKSFLANQPASAS